jgi:hypothetical protein
MAHGVLGVDPSGLLEREELHGFEAFEAAA